MTNGSLRHIVTPCCVRANYVDARTMAKNMGSRLSGGLPSNALHDEVLAKGDSWKTMQKRYPAWAEGILVYPAKGKKFKKGDIVDSETGWTIPWADLIKYVPKSEISGKAKSLLIRPDAIRNEGGRTIVIPSGSIKILCPSIQESGASGKMDLATGVPLAIKPESEFEERWLHRIEGMGVRPIVRGFEGISSARARQTIYANKKPGELFAVTLEELIMSEPDQTLPAEAQYIRSQTPSGGLIPAELQPLILDAKAAFDELRSFVVPEKLATLQKLLEELSKK